MNRWAAMLAELPATLQRQIARRQRISLPRRCTPEERLHRMRSALCHAVTVRVVFFGLDADARAALQALRHERGGIRPAELERRYGPVRPLRALAADPRPRSLSEQLLLLGWLLPRAAAPRNPAHYLLPPELRRWLPRPLALASCGPAPAPPHPPADGAAVALLLACADQPLATRADGGLRRAAIARVCPRIAPFAADPAALAAFTWSLLRQFGMVSAHAGSARITPAGQQFLAAPLAARRARLVKAWVALPTPDPWVTALRVETRGLDWPLLRQRLLTWADALPAGQRLAAAGLYDQLSAALGPLADAWTHGFRFRQVQRTPWLPHCAAAVWAAAVRGPLVWLGALALSDDALLFRPTAEELPTQPGRAEAAQLSDRALHSGASAPLHRAGAAVSHSAPLPPTADPLAPDWAYGPDATVIVPHAAADGCLALARCCDWQQADATTTTYRLSPASLARAASQGHSPALLAELLRRRAGPPPPGWGAGLDLAPPTMRVAPVILLTVADPATLDQAARARSVRRYLSQRLAPGLALVEPEHVAGLARALERQGLAAMISVTAAPAATAPELHPGERAALLLACAFYRHHAPPAAPLAPSPELEERLRAALPLTLRTATDAALTALDLAPPRPAPIPWEPPTSQMADPPAPAREARALRVLRRAIATRGAVRLRYRDAEGVCAERVVRPLELQRRGGHWYLQAHCLCRNAERTFRVDRIVQIVARSATPKLVAATPDAGRETSLEVAHAVGGGLCL